MPRITTITDARELVGRTFERDGVRIEFRGVMHEPGKYTEAEGGFQCLTCVK